MKRIAIVLTSHATLGSTGKATGYYLPKAAHAWAVFRAAGHDVVFVSPKGGSAPLDPNGQDRMRARSSYRLTARAAIVRAACGSPSSSRSPAARVTTVRRLRLRPT